MPGVSTLDSVRRCFRGLQELGEGALAQLDDAELFVSHEPDSNSIAIMIKHMAGNMRSRWTDFLTTDGEKPDRDRDREFEVGPADSAPRLRAEWNAGWRRLFDVLGSLRPDDLTKTVTIRGEPLTVIDAIHRQLAHYAYHVGQIVYLARLFRGPQWQTLSIPRGGSADFNRALRARRDGR